MTGARSPGSRRKPTGGRTLTPAFRGTVIATLCAVLVACTDSGGAPSDEPTLSVDTVATGLVTPWALAFPPDGRIFLTERPGRVRVLTPDRVLEPEPLAEIDVAAQGEGGLLGIAVDPEFARNRRLYLYLTYRDDAGLRNRVVSYAESGGRLSPPTVVLDGIPGAAIHNGGRIAFGPDRRLYVTTGDAARPELAQDRTSLAGKVLRINPDGSVPQDNPFPGSPVYSYGHRNPQGLAWQPDTRQLYATEHGASGNDELNLVEPGRNYGWPLVQGRAHGSFRAPLAVYDSAIAPSGAAWYQGGGMSPWQGSLLFTTLRGTHLRRATLEEGGAGGVAQQEAVFDDRFGRLRDVQVGPDGQLYMVTSNRDGRGDPSAEDDRVLQVRWR